MHAVNIGVFALFFFLVESGKLPNPPIFTSIQHYPSICYLPPDSALCPSKTNALSDSEEKPDENMQIRYYFDVATESCYPFGVQMCGGNENNFASIGECQTTCHLK
uniref:BPTI/Kunitz inhibitor domain-containing protein n=1 Tax=Steinernema glaseri TaxID=37863 RepID=A0A1I7Z006_9BILA